MDKNSIKILVVDDEEGILDVTEAFFERKGYQVYTAENGAKAMDIVSREKIDCVFTDINMPVMDGLELAERIRHIESTLPVVVMTGYPSLENTIQTLKNGVVDYLIKPVNLEQMELTLCRILRERGLFIENLILKEEVERRERLRQLNNELIKKVEDVNTLNRVMEDFATIDSSYEIFNKVVRLGVEELKADLVFFHVYSEQDNFLVLVGKAGAKNKKYPASYSTDIPEQEKAFIIESLGNDHTPCLIADAVSIPSMRGQVHSFMVAPLKIRDKIFGVVSAYIFQGPRFFSEQDIYYLSFITQKAASGIENIALYENIYENLFSTLFAFVTALEVRDLYTRKHSTRVARVSHMIAGEMGCTEEELDMINVAGSLHDIGKIGIRDDILLKPGRLTEDEYEKIKEHPAIGADIISKLGLWGREAQIIRHHHECFDGTGYPDGLKGEQIPKLARILSVADSYDAMASDRAYRKKMDKNVVLDIIIKNSGSQFDPDVVDAFLRVADQDLPDDF
ncbi:HD domain-containing phosphohydrolase [Desulfobacter vibrioformis]|uniref:HD domain-containing phosphohydrolase n=1 Tax=Desulfobacter vibrioformis TaxID=34031 RepID=UPI00054D5404|nr:HD domain-containing phosphohydrolase [Desulfobacter vibrioformis]